MAISQAQRWAGLLLALALAGSLLPNVVAEPLRILAFLVVLGFAVPGLNWRKLISVSWLLVPLWLVTLTVIQGSVHWNTASYGILVLAVLLGIRWLDRRWLVIGLIVAILAQVVAWVVQMAISPEAPLFHDQLSWTQSKSWAGLFTQVTPFLFLIGLAGWVMLAWSVLARRWLSALPAVGLLAIAFFGEGRGVVASGALAFLVVMIGQRRWFIAFELLGVVALGLVLTDAGHRILDLVDPDVWTQGQGSLSNRLALWTCAWEQFKTAVWVGHGIFAAASLCPISESLAFDSPHNLVLRLLLDFGLLGAVPALTLIVWTARWAWRRRVGDSLSLAAGVAMLVWLAFAVYDDVWFRRYLDWLAVIVALLVARPASGK